MRFPASLTGPCHRALQGAVVLALLTLYLVNIYPSFAQDEGDITVSVDALFDFEVPVTVISNGVGLALATALTPPNDLDDAEIMMDNLSSTIGSTYYTDSALSSLGNSTYAAYIPSLSTAQYSRAVLNLATNDQSLSIGQGVPTPILGTFGLASLNELPSTLLSGDSPASVSLGTINPVSASFPSSFFVSELTVDACKSIDGGRLASAVQGIDADGFLGWLRRGYEPALTTWCNFVNQSWLSNITRGASKVVCILLFWFLAYKFVLSKIFLIIDSALNTVRTSKLGGN